MTDETGIVWRGWDASVWDMLDGPVRITEDGIKGLHFPPFDVYARRTPALAGRRRTGQRYQERPIRIPIDVGVEQSLASFTSTEAAFWRTIRADQPGRLEVTAPKPGGGVAMRYVELVADSGMDVELATDPFAIIEPSTQEVMGYAALLEMVADFPFWRGALQSVQLQAASAGLPTFPDDGGASDYVIFLSPSHTVDAATISNPGDLPAWPKYTIYGDVSGFTIGIGDGVIAAPPTLVIPAGGRLVIDTDPTKQLAYLYASAADTTGTLVMRSLSSFGFRPVPPASSLPLSVVLSGGGSLLVELSPLHCRAWG